MDLQRAYEVLKVFYADNKRHLAVINCYAIEYILKVLDDAITHGIIADKDGKIK